LWIWNAAGLRRLHAITVRVLSIFINTTKPPLTWRFPSHSNLLRNSVLRNALPHPRHLRRHQPTHPSRRHSQAGTADGQLARQAQGLASGGTLIALKVLLEDPYDLNIAIRSR